MVILIRNISCVEKCLLHTNRLDASRLAAYSTIHDARHRLTDYKRGKGGRSSFSGVVATVFGASGFLGRHVVNRLGKVGSQIICPYRGDASDMRELKLMGDLGQVLFMPYLLDDEDAIRKAVQHSNLVINLVGKSNPTSNFPFEKVHVEGAGRIARISKELGVEKLVHLSALNCSKNPPGHILPKGSEFLRSKFYGELEVRREFPEAIIFRPSDMYGQMDDFLFYYARAYRRVRFLSQYYLPIWHGGKETVKQPVFGSDVAEGIINAIFNPDSAGQVYEAVGPRRYRLDHLLRYLFDVLRYDEDSMKFVDYNRFLPFHFKRRLLEALRPVYPPVSLDRMEREYVTDVLTGRPTLEDLGVELTLLENRVFWELKPYRRYNYYWDSIGEFPEPDPPQQAPA